MTARRLALGIAVAASALATSAGAAHADFRDGTIFVDTAANGRLDVGPLFVFRSPANANNTVFVMTASPFTGVLTPAVFVKGARYDIAIDGSGDLVEDMVLRTTFGPPSATDGSQSVLLRCLPKPRCRRYVLARGRTGQNIALLGGGTFRAGNRDNPEFFDQGRGLPAARTASMDRTRTRWRSCSSCRPRASPLHRTTRTGSSRCGPARSPTAAAGTARGGHSSTPA